MSSTEPVDPQLKLHVSFSEADLDFADSLLAELADLDRFELSVTPDTQDSAADWVHTAGGLIEAADVVVFVLSSASTEHPTIAFETERAGMLSKRMLTITCEPLRPIEMPEEVSGIKPVRMETNRQLKGNFWLLIRSLDEDAGWIRRHTQLYAQARRWQDAGHNEALLLTKPEIDAAKAWTFERSASAPKPTDLHMEFIAASEMALSAGPRGAKTTALIYPLAEPVTSRRRARRKEKPAAVEDKSTPSIIDEIRRSKHEQSLPPMVKEPPKPKPVPLKFSPKPKTAAKTISVDLTSLAYVPSSLKVWSMPNGRTHTCPGPGEANETIRPSKSKAPARQVSSDETDDALKEKARLLKSRIGKKSARRVQAVIAQDELDGLLSSLLPDADDGRS